MANRRYNQFHFSLIPKLTSIFGQFSIGASGAVAAYSGNGLSTVTKLTTGIYQLLLQDNFNAFLNAEFRCHSPTTGSNVADGSFVANTLYQITSVGTTSWSAIGLNSNLTPAVGQCFVATGVGGAGTGTAKAVTVTGLSQIEVVQNVQNSLNNTGTSAFPGVGGIILIQTLAATAAGNTALIPSHPVSGSIITFELVFRNSVLTA